MGVISQEGLPVSGETGLREVEALRRERASVGDHLWLQERKCLESELLSVGVAQRWGRWRPSWQSLACNVRVPTSITELGQRRLCSKLSGNFTVG